MMKLFVLSCVFAAAAATVPYYVSPVAITAPSFGYPVLPYPYNPHLAIKSIDHGFHSLKKRSVTRLAVAPRSVVFSTADNIGLTAPVTFDPTGFSAAILANPIGISTPFTSGPIGITTPIVVGSGISSPVATPIVAGSTGISTPSVAGSLGVSTPVAGISAAINTSPITFPSPIAVSAPTGPVNTSPAAVGSTGAATAVPVIRNF